MTKTTELLNRALYAFKHFNEMPELQADIEKALASAPKPQAIGPRLMTRVEAYNEAGNFARDIVPAMLAALAPFVGKMVLNQGNVRNAKLMRALPDDSAGTVRQNYHYTNSGYSLRAQFRVCKEVPGQSGGVSANIDVTLAELENGTLRTVYTMKEILPAMRNDYTAEQVAQARAEHDAALRATDQAYSDCQPFGLYDY